MYFNVCILVNQTNNETDHQCADKASEVILKFDHNLETAPYKRYLDAEEVASMSKHYQTAEPQELAAKLEDWDGEPGGVDDQGLYVLSTQNPEGKFDRGDLIDLIPRDQWEHVFLSGKDDLMSRAVITPDGKWHDEWDLMKEGLEGEERLNEWERQVKILFETYTDATAFLASLHS